LNIWLYGAYLLCSVGGMVLFKLGMERSAFRYLDKLLQLSIDPLSLFGLTMYFCSFLLWTVILRKTQLTYGIAILSGLSYMLIMISGFVVFKETISPWKIAGISAILAGIIMINIK